MKHTDHTPGPWTAKTYGKYGEYQVESGDRALIIASRIGCRAGSPAECEANARLITDAPRLAARVERLEDENARLYSAVRLLGIAFHYGTDSDEWKNSINEVHAALRMDEIVGELHFLTPSRARLAGASRLTSGALGLG